MSRELALTQYRRRADKVAALASPAPRDSICGAHRAITERVANLLAGFRSDGSIEVELEHWQPPAEARLILDATPAPERPLYQQDFRSGGHGFFVDACAGPALLARTTTAPNGQQYVVDMCPVKARRILAGGFVSPESILQDTLF